MATSDDDIPVLTDIVAAVPVVSPLPRAEAASDEPPTLSIFAEPDARVPAPAPSEPRFDWGTPVEDTPPYALGGAPAGLEPAPSADAPATEAPPAPIPAAFVAPAEPAANDAPRPPADADESRDAMETRIFEALAARMDRLLDERLEALVPSIVEASLAGVKAGLSASVRQALREAVETAIRDEFDRRP
jgi:hypothetical protein